MLGHNAGRSSRMLAAQSLEVDVNADKRNKQPVVQGLDARSLATVLPVIEAHLLGMKFGQLTIIVQDGVVVQLDRTDRHRVR